MMQLGKDDLLVIEGIHGLNDKLSVFDSERKEIQDLHQCADTARYR